MSAETVQDIIIKAVTDKEYRELLFSDPDKALEEFDLTDEEIEGLKGLEREKFDVAADELEERVSRAGFGLATELKPAEFADVLRKTGVWTR